MPYEYDPLQELMEERKAIGKAMAQKQLFALLNENPGLFGGATESQGGGIYLKNPLASDAGGMFGFRSPDDMRKMAFQSQVSDYMNAKKTWENRPAKVGPGSPFLPAKKRLKELNPQFKGREFMQSESGGYREVKPNLVSKDLTDGLSAEQQVKGRYLARRLYGVRGAEKGLPAVFALMKKGKNIDEIEDTLRFAGQSKEFTGSIRDAAQTILLDAPENVSQKTLDYMDDLLSKGDITGVKSQLKRLSRTRAGVDESRSVSGKERTIKLLDEIQEDLAKLEQSGVSTNIFTGTAEQIASKIGAVRSPDARRIATKIGAAIQSYRRAMSGVAFSEPESREYKALFPSIGKTANFNLANMQGLREVMQGDLDNFYALAMGERNYRTLFGSMRQPADASSMIKSTKPALKSGKTKSYRSLWE